MGRIAFLTAIFLIYLAVMFGLASIPERTLQETVNAVGVAVIN